MTAATPHSEHDSSEPLHIGVDQRVRAAFEQTGPSGALLAVGGYGRGDLFPHSDVDLLLLVENTPGKEPIAEFLRILWDTGHRVSHSVRTVAECCELHTGNLELTISLLDRRFLCGDVRLFEQLEAAFPKFLQANRKVITEELSKSTRERHAKDHNTIHHLEPDVKEHPGALRDFHVLEWLQRLKPYEAEPLDEHRRFLSGVRHFLHGFHGRDNNVLTFGAQEKLSENPAAWMRQYYIHARAVLREVERAMELAEEQPGGLLTQFRDWRSRLSTSEFTISREKILLRDPARVLSDPASVARLLEFSARHNLRLARDTERRLSERKDEPLPLKWPALKPVFSQPHFSLALRAMRDCGLLPRILPEWNRIDCLVVRDFYHRYTVDEHSIVAIESLEELRATTGHVRRQFAELLQELDRPDLLRLALLLHDIGKGAGTGEHAHESVRLSRQILDRLEVPARDAETVLFLIEHHLDLSSVMTTRDLSDPRAIRELTSRTLTIENLKFLTLMTYADISAVNPGAMTPWRLEQLWRVYLAGSEAHTRELEGERIVETAGDPEFMRGLPARYLRTHTRAEIERHAALAKEGTAVEIEKAAGGYQALVIAPDRPFLLAAISGAIASFGLNILKAEVFTNAGGLAIDSFTFADPHRTLELNPSESDRLRDTILRVLSGKLDVAKLLSRRPRTKPPTREARVEPRVVFNNESSERATLIEIIAEDRPGLLYDLTRAISGSGANIDVVLIDTEAHRALDVFYVTREGKKLSKPVEETLRESLLAACRGAA